MANERLHWIYKKTAGIFALNIGHFFLMFLNGLILTHYLSASGYGLYVYIVSWVGMFSLFSVLGMDTLLLRQVAVYKTRKEWSWLSGIIKWANIFPVLASLLAMLAITILIRTQSIALKDINIILPIIWLLILLNVSVQLQSSTLLGFSRVIAGQLSATLVIPAVVVILVLSIRIFTGPVLSINEVLASRVIALCCALVISKCFIKQSIPDEAKNTIPEFDHKMWLFSAAPLCLIQGLEYINRNIDLMLLGAISDKEAVGIFSIATHGATFISFALHTVNTVMAPTIARFWASGDVIRLQKLITKGARLAFSVSFPITVAMIWFGPVLLSLFGKEFCEGYYALVILSLSELLNTAIGSVAYILILTGYEKETVIGLGIGASLHCLISLWLIPAHGVNGAAIATAVSLLVWKVFLVWRVWRRLKIVPTILGHISGKQAVNI